MRALSNYSNTVALARVAPHHTEHACTPSTHVAFKHT